MVVLDCFYIELVEVNFDLCVWVGNFDELVSNCFGGVFKVFKYWVSELESELELVSGWVIIVFNEEVVVFVCLVNQGGFNLVVSYEVFCVKMFGVVCQILIFVCQQKEVGCLVGWLGWLLVVILYIWENGKNQQLYQDIIFCEVLFGEMSDMVWVFFLVDYNSVLVLLLMIYCSWG